MQISLDNAAVTTVNFIMPSRTTPIVNSEYYFGFTASTGGDVAQLRVYSWDVTSLNRKSGQHLFLF